MSCTGYHMPHNVMLPGGKLARLMCADCKVEIPSAFTAGSATVRAVVGQLDQRGGEVEVALTREGRYLVGHSRQDEIGGFSVLCDVTEQLRRLGADEAHSLRKIVANYWNAVDIMLDGPDDSDVAMAMVKLSRAHKAAKAVLAAVPIPAEEGDA